LGLKTDFAENRVRVNVAAFFNKYEDIILRLNRCPGANPTPCQLPANVGSADVKGIELESSMLLGSGFSIDLAASWLDFQYTETDIVNTSIPLDYITPFTPETKGSWDCSGRRNSRVTTPSWRAPDIAYQSDVYGDAFNNPFNHIPSYGVGNLRLTWRGPEDQWEASAEVTNVTDKLFYLATNDYSASAGSSSFAPGLPRTWAITVKRHWD
jgi:iron complex outermembrane receptor protein